MTFDEKTEQAISENHFVGKFQIFFEKNQRSELENFIKNYPAKKTFFIDFKELEHFDFELADELLENPDYTLEAAKIALKEINLLNLKTEELNPEIEVKNIPEQENVEIGGIGHSHFNKLVKVTGIVYNIERKISTPFSGNWECQHCGNTFVIRNGLQGLFSDLKKPVVCECRQSKFVLKRQESDYRDIQKVTIRSENILPAHVKSDLLVILQGENINSVDLNDIVEATGILRSIFDKTENATDYYLDCMQLNKTGKGQIPLSAEIDKMSGDDFTKFVARIFTIKGYNAQITGAPGDLGIDMVLTKGSRRIGIQCKRWKKPINRQAVSDVVGAQKGYKCNELWVITSNYGTTKTLEFARTHNVRVIDRAELDAIIGETEGIDLINLERTSSFEQILVQEKRKAENEIQRQIASKLTLRNFFELKDAVDSYREQNYEMVQEVVKKLLKEEIIAEIEKDVFALKGKELKARENYKRFKEQFSPDFLDETDPILLQQLEKVLKLVRSLNEYLDMIPMEEVLTKTKELGIEEEKAKEIIKRLEKTGDIYRPKHGFVKATQH